MKKIYILSLLLMIFTFTSCTKSKEYDVNDYRTTMKFHDDFKILQITDIHLGIESDLKHQLSIVENYITEADPDLVILTGDNFMYGSKGIVKNLLYTLNETCKTLTSKHPERLTKFAITYGNHDNQGDYPRYYINKTVLKYATTDGNEIKDGKYAAFIDYKDDNLFGFTNYFIDLVDDRTKSVDTVDVKYRLHIIDSNTYMYLGKKYGYDIIRDDQLEHAVNIYNNATTDKDYIGMAFFHIPFPEFQDALDQYTSSSNPEQIGQGLVLEEAAIPKVNNGSYEKLKSANIISYFVGHDHINACDIIYNADKDISEQAIFSYGVKATNTIYYDESLVGYKTINLKDNMTKEQFLTIENINNNFKNIIDRNSQYE